MNFLKISVSLFMLLVVGLASIQMVQAQGRQNGNQTPYHYPYQYFYHYRPMDNDAQFMHLPRVSEVVASLRSR